MTEGLNPIDGSVLLVFSIVLILQQPGLPS
jgi:hypothetical protein